MIFDFVLRIAEAMLQQSVQQLVVVGLRCIVLAANVVKSRLLTPQLQYAPVCSACARLFYLWKKIRKSALFVATARIWLQKANTNIIVRLHATARSMPYKMNSSITVPLSMLRAPAAGQYDSQSGLIAKD